MSHVPCSDEFLLNVWYQKKKKKKKSKKKKTKKRKVLFRLLVRFMS